ncbi:hypothetical protein SAY87_002271 [Trapa incisa]|uniref:Uncharacterized protein n=1 Tax=Trapa incisa TaxID=236973 RepID=A0AAN7JWI1_9MYRT|nr:hypothetical protein SAY87_002271 [Trapa incisa]
MNPSSTTDNGNKSAPEGGGGQVNSTVTSASAGQGQQLRDLQVPHQSQNNPAAPKTSGGVLTAAAASAASSLQFAKEAISGK